MKPTLLVDLDGVLADFDGRCWDVARAYRLNLDIEDRSTQTRYYLTDHIIGGEMMGKRAAQRRMRSRIDRDPLWFASLDVIPGAQDGVRELEEVFDVWVCTKPLMTNVNCASDKLAWVRNHFPTLAEKVIITPDKSMVRGDVLLDDHPKPAQAHRALWQPVVFRQPYNALLQAEQAWDGFSWGDDPSVLLKNADYARFKVDRFAA